MHLYAEHMDMKRNVEKFSQFGPDTQYLIINFQQHSLHNMVHLRL